MTISERILEATAGVRDQATAYAGRAVDAARNGAQRAAAGFEAVEAPVDTLADAGRQLNALSYQYAGRMLDQGVQTVHGFIEDGAQRLRHAAKAGDVRSLYRAQLEQLPASRDRIVKDALATWEIVAETGRELQSLALTTYARLVRKNTRARKTATTAKTAKTARSRGRRAASKAAH
ncbi:MAG: phasin family protein [Steroidobacteraceae bacterium]